jgi:formyltetrahydrofolate-dependent phosphoribosylglycinamide formyltransferase
VTVRLVVLASGSGSTLQAILDATADPAFGAQVVAAGTDRPGCQAMRRAADAGVPTFAVPLADFADRASWDAGLADAIAGHRPDLVLLAGFMRVLAADTVNRFEMINTHPSLLPSFPGGHAVADALAHGVKITGVTVHRVDAGLDSGPILAQAAVPVLPGDTVDSLRERIQLAEKPLFLSTIRQLCQSRQFRSEPPPHNTDRTPEEIRP